MREESHLDDMRAAIRGDFERLERRLGSQELMHVREEEPAPDFGPDPDLEPEPLQELATVAEAASDPAEAGPVDSVPVEHVERPRSWLARLLAAIAPRQV